MIDDSLNNYIAQYSNNHPEVRVIRERMDAVMRQTRSISGYEELTRSDRDRLAEINRHWEDSFNITGRHTLLQLIPLNRCSDGRYYYTYTRIQDGMRRIRIFDNAQDFLNNALLDNLFEFLEGGLPSGSV